MWNHPLVLGLLELVAPLRCPACDAVLEAHGEPAALATPSWPNLPNAALDGFCGACRPLLEPAAQDVALYEYGGPLADAIKRFKYQGRLDTLEALAALVSAAAPRFVGAVDCVVPVPLHRARRLQRGFDQAALLCQPLSKRLGVPLKRRCLRRTRDTPAQATLTARERQQNLRGAFQCKPLTDQRVLLFDDVCTTGATLDAAESALRQAGASEVRRLCLALRV